MPVNDEKAVAADGVEDDGGKDVISSSLGGFARTLAKPFRNYVGSADDGSVVWLFKRIAYWLGVGARALSEAVSRATRGMTGKSGDE